MVFENQLFVQPLADFRAMAQTGDMCGRLALTLPVDAVAGWFDAVQIRATLDRARYNICPSQKIPVAVTFEGARQLVSMRWGFIPHWYTAPGDGPMLINARGETLAEKTAFRAAAKARRCLIPASGFYEWQREKGKQSLPWYFHPKDQELMAFAGIWQVWNGSEEQRIVSCAMVTTAAQSEMEAVHNREPVVIDQSDYGLWLGEKDHGAARLIEAAKPGFYARHRVSVAVNSGREDDASLIEPLEE